MKKTDQLRLFILDIFRLHGLLYYQEGQALANDSGLSPARWRLLGTLIRAQRGLTVPEIAGQAQQARQSVQRLVNDMAEQGWVRSIQNPDHARSRIIEITENGRRIYDHMQPALDAWLSGLGSDLKREEIHEARKVMDKLLKRIDRSVSP